VTASRRAVATAGRLLRDRIGLRPEPALQSRLTRAIDDAAMAAGEAPDEFVDALASDPAHLQTLCDRVTVQESGFFRHPEQFEVLAHRILPAIAGPVLIWSAGCANGQEAYSLAMLMTELGIDGRVLATDVSAAAVRRTREAEYSDREIAALSPSRRAMFCTQTGSTWTIRTDVRERVQANVGNLLDPLPAEASVCHVVFCRNVLIYFTPEHARSFLDRLAATMPAGAYLFLGAAESLWHITDRFEPLRHDDTFVHRVRTGTPAPAARRPRRAAPPVATRATPPRRPPTPPASVVDVSELARAGIEAHRNGDQPTAIRSFRQWTYVEPDEALAHFHLALALEAHGDAGAAARAFAATRATLVRRGEHTAVEAFGGYGLADVLRLLDAKERGVRS
jgi:chemotaxis methyl-accepting protein methylase